MITILLSVIAFTAVSLSLTGIILYFDSKLYHNKKVKINIKNNNSILEVDTGNHLLGTLADNDLFLPSSCGAGGTCGLCKCQITKGGGAILPTETSFIDRKLQKDNWRLACQVKVKEDMEIVLPDEIFNIKQVECRVVSNNNISTYIKELVLELPDNEEFIFEPGGYIQIEIPHYKIHFDKDITIDEEYRKEWEKNNFFSLKAANHTYRNRAYSMANYPAEKGKLKLNVRIALPPFNKKKNRLEKLSPGVASSYIFSLKAGDRVNILGPYGDFFPTESDREMIYIGGGAGMAPLRSHIFHLFKTMKTSRKVSYWYGARSPKELFYGKEFKEIEKDFDNFSFNVAYSQVDSGESSEGYKGFIHEVLYENYLKNHENPDELEFYLCGPPLMMDALLKMLDNFGIDPDMIKFDDFGS